MTCPDCKALRTRILHLERALGYHLSRTEVHAIQRKFAVGPIAAQMALMMYNAIDLVANDRLQTVCEGFDAAKVHINRLRKALPPLSVHNLHGEGYSLTPVGRAAIFSAIAPHRELAKAVDNSAISANDDYEAMTTQLAILTGRLAAVGGVQEVRKILIRLERALVAHDHSATVVLDEPA